MQFDVAHYLGAVTREVAAREHDGKPARVVVISRNYDTDIDDLWDVLTSAERIPRWFLPVSGDLKLGGRYQFEGNAGGTITRCEPPRRLGVTWEFGGMVSWVEVRLSEDAQGARLELEHIVRPDGHWEQFGPGAVGVGWEAAMLGLAKHLATGAPVDRAEGMAWMASDDGRTFMTSSSEAWMRASIASGEDEAVARARADRTTAAYAGQG
jgi:uncharacterized protein YndB with AHSA1/START domain